MSQSISSTNGALQALSSIDVAIQDTSRIRGSLGAAQNRLEHTIDNIQIMRSNITAANSRIRDADVAAEASEMARINILTQAATSMVAQANQLPQMALQLLQ
jgi:flagellin